MTQQANTQPTQPTSARARLDAQLDSLHGHNLFRDFDLPQPSGTPYVRDLFSDRPRPIDVPRVREATSTARPHQPPSTTTEMVTDAFATLMGNRADNNTKKG